MADAPKLDPAFVARHGLDRPENADVARAVPKILKAAGVPDEAEKPKPKAVGMKALAGAGSAKAALTIAGIKTIIIALDKAVHLAKDAGVPLPAWLDKTLAFVDEIVVEIKAA